MVLKERFSLSPDGQIGGVEERVGDKEVEDLLNKLEKELGVKIPKEIRDRLWLLNRRIKNEGGERDSETETHLEHSLQVQKMCHEMVSKFFQEELGDMLPQIDLSCILHDIGKTGPVSSGEKAHDDKVQEMFITLFSFINKRRINGKPLPENSIEESLETFYPLSARGQQECLALLSEMRIKPVDEMRKIYNLHGKYTKQLLEETNIDSEVVYMACNHHSLGNGNGKMEVKDLVLDPDSEEQKKLDKAVALIYFCDFYEAASKRGKKSNGEILQMILGSVAEKYKPFINEIINRFN